MAQVAGENAFTTLNGYFKEAYAKNVVRLVPAAAVIMKRVKFSESEGALGNLYHQPVILTQEHGVTYAAASSGAFSLNAAIAATMKDATVEGAQLLLRARIDYESAARAARSEKAFGDATELLVENMLESISKRLEIMFLYGRTGIGAVNAGTVGVTTFVVSDLTWAPGIWCGAENAKLDVLSSNLATARFTNVAVSSVDLGTKTVTLASVQTLTQGDLVFFAGAVVAGGSPTYNEAIGLDGIINIGSATSLFGINPQSFTLWKGNTNSAGSGALTVTIILQSLQKAVAKGAMGDMMLICAPAKFSGMVEPLVDPKATAGARKVDTSYKGARLEVGSESMVIHSPIGKIEVVPHLFCKEGEAFLFPVKSLMRVGATDVTFNTPARGDEFFLQIPDYAGYELRCYANQALFCSSPGRCVKITNIV